jgi:hypothetical protein
MKKIFTISIIVLCAAGIIWFIGTEFLNSPKLQNQPDKASLKTISASYLTGFEAEFYSISYTLNYDPKIFIARPMASAQNTIQLYEKSTGNLNTIKIFYNGAAGFSSPQNIWETLYKPNCPKCTKVGAPLLIQDAVAYTDNSDEWIIYPHAPGFVIAHFKIPANDAIQVLSTLDINLSQTEKRPDSTSVKIFFGEKNTGENCATVYPITKYITKTPQIATAAVELLIQGPTDDEKSAGYFSSVPTNTFINSIAINNGVAKIDFSKEVESGGGSCSMAMRVAQIKQTLLQFPTVKNVVLSINGQTEPIFQP